MSDPSDLPPDLERLESRLKALRPAPVSDALQQKLEGISTPRVLPARLNTWWRPALVAMVALCLTPLISRVVSNPSTRVVQPKVVEVKVVVPSWVVYQRAIQDGNLEEVLSEQAYQYSSSASLVTASGKKF